MGDDEGSGSGDAGAAGPWSKKTLAVCGVIVAVCTAVLSLKSVLGPAWNAVLGHDNGGSTPSATSTPAGTGARKPPGRPTTATRAGATPTAASSSPAAGTGLWSGTLVLGPLGAGDKDLDVHPPAHATTDADNDLYITSPTPATLYALGNAYIAVWRDPGAPPTAADCVSAIGSASADGVPLAKGTVVCARTGEGRIARLTVTATPGNGIGTATFDAVVWQTA
jgi:hypothetical protein